MRPDQPARKRRHARAKQHPAPAHAFHVRNAQLGQQERGAAIGAPGVFEDLDRDVRDVGDARLAGREAGVVEQDGRRAQLLEDVLMELAYVIVVAEVGLEGFGSDVVGGAQVGDEGGGGGGVGVVVDGEGAAEGGEGAAGGGADAAGGSGDKGEMIGEVFGKHG